MCVLILSEIFETFLILRTLERDMIKNVHWSSKYPYFFHTVMKIKFSQQISEKYSYFNENPFSGSRVVPRGWADGGTDITKLIVVSRHFTKPPETAP